MREKPAVVFDRRHARQDRVEGVGDLGRARQIELDVLGPLDGVGDVADRSVTAG